MPFCIELPIPNEHIWVELIPDRPAKVVVWSEEKPFFELGVLVIGEKIIHYQKLSREWLEQNYHHIRNLATTAEGFPAHAKAVKVRLIKPEGDSG